MNDLDWAKLSAASQLEIDNLATEFENHVIQKRTPSINEYLIRTSEQLRPYLYVTLLDLQAAHARMSAIRERFRGQQPDWETVAEDILSRSSDYQELFLLKDYHLAFPNELPISEVDLNLIALEIRVRKNNDDLPTREEYEADFPHLRNQISQALIETPIVGDDATIAFEVAPNRSDNVNEVVGKYRLLKIIGSGGMGRVYVAQHTDMHRKVALKLIRPSLLDGSRAKIRFRAEMAILAQLDHQNIVRAYDAEAGLKGAIPFLAMELLSGPSLRELVDQDGPLSIREACTLLAGVADGLACAHAANLVHRDIKPHNLLLSQSQTETRVAKIVDFGLARKNSSLAVENDDSYGQTSITLADECLGTPDYAAPEQFLRTQPVGPEADYYGLGCTLYFLLQGTAPFDTPEHPTIQERFHAHVSVTPPQISSWRGESIPQKLQELYGQLMEKNPAARPQNGRHIAETLRRIADTQYADQEKSTCVEEEQRLDSEKRFSTWPVALVLSSFALLACLIATVIAPSDVPRSGKNSSNTDLANETSRASVSADNKEYRGTDSQEEFNVGLTQDVRLTQFDVFVRRRIQNEEGKEKFSKPISVTETEVFVGDGARIRLGFDRPSHYFLLAFNPTDSTEFSVQPLIPGFQAPDPAQTSVAFPAETSDLYEMTDGYGQQAFVLIYSNVPLPSYAEFLGKFPQLFTWKRFDSDDEVWNYHNGKFVDGYGERQQRGTVRFYGPNHLRAVLDHAFEILEAENIHLAARAFRVRREVLTSEP